MHTFLEFPISRKSIGLINYQLMIKFMYKYMYIFMQVIFKDPIISNQTELRVLYIRSILFQRPKNVISIFPTKVLQINTFFLSICLYGLGIWSGEFLKLSTCIRLGGHHVFLSWVNNRSSKARRGQGQGRTYTLYINLSTGERPLQR